MLAFLILLLAAIFNNPRIGLFMSIHSSFSIVPLSNYLPPLPFPAGLLVDFFLLVTLVATLLKIKQEDWLKVSRGVLLFISVWFLLTALQIFNPEARSAEAWLYAIRSTSFQMFITIILALLLLRSPKDLQSVLFIFLLWSVPAALNGIRQLHIGLTDAENAWLAAGAARTHVLFGKLRVFSYFTDAGTFGAAQAMAVVIAGILALNAEGFRKKLIYGLVAVLCFYGMAISGTRGALFVIFAGFGTYFLLCGKVKVLISGLIVGIVFFGFLKFTSIGNTNYQIYRMRSALNPEDASFQVRVNNQRILAEYMGSRPFGAGVGSIGFWGKRFTPNTFLGEMPTDNWYVRIWVETGWTGLTFYLSMLLYLLVAGFRRIFSLKDKIIRYKSAALYCAIAGLAVASYGNELWGTFPIAPFNYIALALAFNGELLVAQKPSAVKPSR